MELRGDAVTVATTTGFYLRYDSDIMTVIIMIIIIILWMLCESHLFWLVLFVLWLDLLGAAVRLEGFTVCVVQSGLTGGPRGVRAVDQSGCVCRTCCDLLWIMCNMCKSEATAAMYTVRENEALDELHFRWFVEDETNQGKQKVFQIIINFTRDV